MNFRWTRILTAAAFLTAAVITLVLAQQPEPPGDDQGGRRGGRGGGFRNMMANMAVGTIVAIDLNNRAVQVQSSFGQGEPRWVAITDQTNMVRQVRGKIADLKEGDTVAIQGVPTAITASQVQIGEMPDLFPRGPGGPGGGGPGGGPQPGRGPALSFASVQGKVTGLDPLTVTIQDKTEVAVKATENTPVTKIEDAGFRDLKQNDFFIASGQPDENGNLYAQTAAIGVDPGQMMGGFGGFRGGGGGGGRRGF